MRVFEGKYIHVGGLEGRLMTLRAATFRTYLFHIWVFIVPFFFT